MPIHLLCLKCGKGFTAKYLVSGFRIETNGELTDLPGASPCCKHESKLDTDKPNKGRLTEMLGGRYD